MLVSVGLPDYHKPLKVGTWIKVRLAASMFLSSHFIIRVPFFLLFGFKFNKGTLTQKGQKGTTQEPRLTSRQPRVRSSKFNRRTPEALLVKGLVRFRV